MIRRIMFGGPGRRKESVFRSALAYDPRGRDTFLLRGKRFADPVAAAPNT